MSTIASLEAENAKLREALELYANKSTWVSPSFSDELWLVAEKALDADGQEITGGLSE